MSKFIVTGGLGFIGSNLVEYLIGLGHTVINIDKSSYSSNSFNVKNLKTSSRYKFYKANINEKKKIIKIIKQFKPQCIFNLAAETHVDRSIDQPEDFINSNIKGVYNLLEAILLSKIKLKLIHISTDEVFGDLKNKRADENAAYNPKNPYAATKAAADHLIRSYVNTYKINAIITNCCNNYGPRQNPEKFIPKLISNILNKKRLPIYGRGQNSREWIYVLDHCRALYEVFKRENNKENYNIGTNQNFKNIEIASKKKLKWKFKIKINEGLITTFKWYLENKNFFTSVKNKDFVNRIGNKR